MKTFFTFVIFLFFLNFNNVASKESFFVEAKNLFNKKKYDDSKFLFQRNIVFNPKHTESYLYLAKIFEIEENESEELKNVNTTLLLDPKNEEALYMLIDIKLKRSNFTEAKELQKRFETACNSLCEKKVSIEQRLKNFDTNNES
mgnify:CR=1 FL=1